MGHGSWEVNPSGVCVSLMMLRWQQSSEISTSVRSVPGQTTHRSQKTAIIVQGLQIDLGVLAVLQRRHILTFRHGSRMGCVAVPLPAREGAPHKQGADTAPHIIFVPHSEAAIRGRL